MKSAGSSRIRREKQGDCACPGFRASTGCFGVLRRGAGPVADGGIKGIAEFAEKDGFGRGGDIEGVAVENRACERELEATEAAPSGKGALQTLRKTCVVVSNVDDDRHLGPHALGGWRSLQATADSDACFKAVGVTPKETERYKGEAQGGRSGYQGEAD